MQEVGATCVEGKTPPTMHPTINLPTRQEAAILTRELVPLKSQC